MHISKVWKRPMQGGNPVTLREAVGFFEQAVALDTAYAPAWARLSQATSLQSIIGVPSPSVAERSRVAGERAIALAPDRPEGHIALGDYYRRIKRDYARALDEYAQGGASRPPTLKDFAVPARRKAGWDVGMRRCSTCSRRRPSTPIGHDRDGAGARWSRCDGIRRP